MHIATDDVVDYDFFVWFDFGTYNILVATSNASIYFFFAKRKRVRHLHTSRGVVLEVCNLVALCFQLLWSVECDVGVARLEELVDVFAIDIATFALAVRAIVATIRHTFVEFDAEPFECLDDILFGTRHEAVRVGVFDTENHIATVLFCK